MGPGCVMLPTVDHVRVLGGSLGRGTGVQTRNHSMAAQEAVEAIFRAARGGDLQGVARMLDEDPRLLSTVSGENRCS
jgi:hypothetical protein